MLTTTAKPLGRANRWGNLIRVGDGSLLIGASSLARHWFHVNSVYFANWFGSTTAASTQRLRQTSKMARCERFEIGAGRWEALPEELLQKMLATFPTAEEETAGIASVGYIPRPLM